MSKRERPVKLEPAGEEGAAPDEVVKDVQKRPICQPAVLAGKIDPILHRIQALRGRRLFVLITGPITDETCEQVYAWRAEFGNPGEGSGLDILLHSPGGILSSCYQIARLVGNRADAWEALIPSFSASGATLIALGSANIVMGEMAALGPIDPQVTSKRNEKLFAQERQSPLEAFEAVRYLQRHLLTSLDIGMDFLLDHGIAAKPALETASRLAVHMVDPILSKIEPYDLGSFSLDSRLSLQYCERIANPSDQAKLTQRRVAFRKLVEYYPAHEFVIDLEEARALGFNVTEPQGELEDLYDQLRPHLDKVKSYIGFVPEPEVVK